MQVILKATIASAALLLAGCESTDSEATATSIGNALGGWVDPGETTPASGIEAFYAGDVTGISYDPVADELIINGTPFDGTEVYVPYPAYDTNGFTAYVNETGQRSYIAFLGTSASGAVVALIVVTPSYINHGFSGAAYALDLESTMPGSGFASYTGSYAGLITYDGVSGFTRTEGDLLLDADFTDGKVEGFILNREIVATGADQPDLILGTSDIDGNAFSGGEAVSFDAGGDEVENGTYEGAFGGDLASEVVGTIVVTDGTGDDEAQETGAFVGDIILP